MNPSSRMSLDYDRFGRNHGASSPFKVMLGLVFTVKAGISSNLFKVMLGLVFTMKPN
jgi:hypothetical protein